MRWWNVRELERAFELAVFFRKMELQGADFLPFSPRKLGAQVQGLLLAPFTLSLPIWLVGSYWLLAENLQQVATQTGGINTNL